MCIKSALCEKKKIEILKRSKWCCPLKIQFFLHFYITDVNIFLIPILYVKLNLKMRFSIVLKMLSHTESTRSWFFFFHRNVCFTAK